MEQSEGRVWGEWFEVWQSGSQDIEEWLVAHPQWEAEFREFIAESASEAEWQRQAREESDQKKKGTNLPVGLRLKAWREERQLRQEDLANFLQVKKAFVSNIENGNKGMSMEILGRLAAIGVDINWILTDKSFAQDNTDTVRVRGYELAPNIPQKLSAGGGQQLLEADFEESSVKAPYPKGWGQGLLCAEVVGDSMTGAHIFDGDLVFFKPGEVRGNGLYVVSLNGTVLVKRLEFDEIERKLTIISENPRYQQRVESADSQAITILGKVRGWMHGHPY